MKIFVPWILYRSPSGVAFVETMWASEPTAGSVRHMLPPQVPSYIFAQKRSFCSGEPKFSIMAPLPGPSPAKQPKEKLALMKTPSPPRPPIRAAPGPGSPSSSQGDQEHQKPSRSA